MPTIQKTKRMFDFIRGVIQSTGEAPTIAEIGRQFNMRSPASVHAHLKRMKAWGWIRRDHYSRFIQIVEQETKKAA